MCNYSGREGMASWIPSLSHIAGLRYGAIVDQLVFRRLPRDWQVIVKARVRGAQQVTYVSGNSLQEAAENLYVSLDERWLTWYRDKFPPKLGRFNR